MGKYKIHHKKYEKCARSLKEVTLRMKQTTSQVHFGPLNRLSTAHAVFEFLEAVYRTSELDRIQDIVNIKNWLMKCDFGRNGIDNWVYQWGMSINVSVSKGVPVKDTFFVRLLGKQMDVLIPLSVRR